MALPARDRHEHQNQIPAAPVSGVRLRAAPATRSWKQREARTGHDHHFLSRLSRVHGAELDLALSIYRDAELVKAILASPLFPKDDDRVAVSLDDSREGPFVVIANNEHFVTCLGRGMSPGRRRIITRAQLDAIRAQLAHEIHAERQAQRARECWERRQTEHDELLSKFAMPERQRKNLARLISIAPTRDGEANASYPFFRVSIFL